jgi:hypothetical protein
LTSSSYLRAGGESLLAEDAPSGVARSDLELAPTKLLEILATGWLAVVQA